MAPPAKRWRKTQNKDQGDDRNDDVVAEPRSFPESVVAEKKSPVVVFAHGAGAPSSSDWMLRWKGMLAKGLEAVEVITFDYPYLAGGKRGAPPKAEKLVSFHTEIVKDALSRYPGHSLVLVGKSMGSRVSCMVAAEEGVNASALVCLGYPLKGTKGAVRDEILLNLGVPTMFVQGSKDGLCPLEKLKAVQKKMKCVNELHVIEGGDHSFKIGKRYLQSKGTTQEEAEDLAIRAIATFIS